MSMCPSLGCFKQNYVEMFDATAGQVPIGRSHRSKINAYSNNCYFILLIESY